MGMFDSTKLHMKFNGRLGQLYITNGKLMWNDGKWVKKYPIAGCEAVFEPGDAPAMATTAGRVAAGLVIAGPLGAIVGGVWKKDQSKSYINVTLADGKMLIADVPSSKATAAREFVSRINEASKAYSK